MSRKIRLSAFIFAVLFFEVLEYVDCRNNTTKDKMFDLLGFVRKSIFCDRKCSLLGWMTGNGKSVHLLRVFFDPKSIQKVREKIGKRIC